MVSVRLVGDPLRRAKVHAAGNRRAGVVVQYRYLDPVASPVQKIDPKGGRRGGALAFHLAPVHLANRFAALADLHRGRWRGRDFHVGGAGAQVGRLAVALHRVCHELVRRGVRQAMHKCGHATVHLYVDVKRAIRQLGVGQRDSDLSPSLSNKWTFVYLAQGYRRDHERWPLGHDFDGLYLVLGVRVLPGPQEVGVLGCPQRR